MQPMPVPAGTTIFRVGDPSSAVYVIEDGEVAITVNGGIEVARLHAGALFGESGVLEARVRAATATATLATTLLVTDAETFFHAFGMNNDRALTLVKLLCARLRNTTARAAQPGFPGLDSDTSAAGPSPIRLLPDSERLAGEYGMVPVDVRHLPFQVGNRYGGETLPIASNRCCCIPARGIGDLAAPHFEILRRDGVVGVRDLGTSTGTCVNGTMISRASLNAFVALRQGDNEVIAGPPGSAFRFCVRFGGL
jgi:CRP-like cAMP-binding protein